MIKASQYEQFNSSSSSSKHLQGISSEIPKARRSYSEEQLSMMEFIHNEKLAGGMAQDLREELQERSLSRSPGDEEFKNLREINISKNNFTPEEIRLPDKIWIHEDVPMKAIRSGGQG